MSQFLEVVNKKYFLKHLPPFYKEATHEEHRKAVQPLYCTERPGQYEAASSRFSPASPTERPL